MDDTSYWFDVGLCLMLITLVETHEGFSVISKGSLFVKYLKLYGVSSSKQCQWKLWAVLVADKKIKNNTFQGF